MEYGPIGGRVHFETQRLVIRDLEANDISALVRLWIDSDVTGTMGGRHRLARADPDPAPTA